MRPTDLSTCIFLHEIGRTHRMYFLICLQCKSIYFVQGEHEKGHYRTEHWKHMHWISFLRVLAMISVQKDGWSAEYLSVLTLERGILTICSLCPYEPPRSADIWSSFTIFFSFLDQATKRANIRTKASYLGCKDTGSLWLWHGHFLANLSDYRPGLNHRSTFDLRAGWSISMKHDAFTTITFSLFFVGASKFMCC